MTESPIGWIGCGRMGSAMVARLLDAGAAVRVTNRTRARADALGERGADVADDPRALADLGLVVVMVTSGAELLAVLEGPGGLLTDPRRAPGVVVDCSTVSSEASARAREACARRGAAFLAAPVSGNPRVVAAGRLTLVASGSPEAFERARPTLELLGAGVTYVGEGELARFVKICHNVVLGVVTQALAEVTVLAERGGVPRRAFLDFLNRSVVGSAFTRYKSPALVNLDFTPTFTATLLQKDFDIALAEARAEGVALPVTALCRELVASAVGAGHGAEDFAVLLAEQARRSGLALAPDAGPVDDGLAS